MDEKSTEVGEVKGRKIGK